MLDAQINKEGSVWVSDTGSMSKDTRYAKTLGLYWHIKSLLGKVMEKGFYMHEYVLNRLDTMQHQMKLMDIKHTMLVKKLWGLEVLVDEPT
jgi:hypothetical protein